MTPAKTSCLDQAIAALFFLLRDVLQHLETGILVADHGHAPTATRLRLAAPQLRDDPVAQQILSQLSHEKRRRTGGVGGELKAHRAGDGQHVGDVVSRIDHGAEEKTIKDIINKTIVIFDITTDWAPASAPHLLSQLRGAAPYRRPDHRRSCRPRNTSIPDAQNRSRTPMLPGTWRKTRSRSCRFHRIA